MDNWKISDSMREWIISNYSQTTILELGSGEGSQLLCEAGHKVYTVEHDIKWLNKYPDPIYFYAPLTYCKQTKLDKDHTLWYERSVIKSIPQDYDLILVDGPPACEGRSGFAKYIALFKSVPILFDDYHRAKDRLLVHWVAQRLKREYTVKDTWKEKCWVIMK